MRANFFIPRKPPCQEENGANLRKLRRLKGKPVEAYPPPRTIDPESNVRNKTESKRDQCESEPEPPCALPEMVVNQRGDNADNKADPKPDSLALEKKISVAVRIARESAD